MLLVVRQECTCQMDLPHPCSVGKDSTNQGIPFRTKLHYTHRLFQDPFQSKNPQCHSCHRFQHSQIPSCRYHRVSNSTKLAYLNFCQHSLPTKKHRLGKILRPVFRLEDNHSPLLFPIVVLPIHFLSPQSP